MRHSALIVPVVFILLGTGTYFPFVLNYVSWWWVLTLPAAVLLADAGWWARAACVAVSASSLALTISGLLGPPPPDVAPLSVPNGETLYVPREEVAAFTALGHALERRDPDTGSLIFIPSGSTAAGVHALYRVPLGLRVYWYLPGYVRPYDEVDILRKLPRLRTVVIARVGEPPPDPCAWLKPGVFSPALCVRLRKAVTGPPRKVASGWWLFPLSAPNAN